MFIDCVAFPEAPKIEKIQDVPPGLEISSEIKKKFKRATHQIPIVVGILKVEIEHFKGDWSFQTRLSNCKRDCIFFFKSRALRVKGRQKVNKLNFLLGVVLPHLPCEILRDGSSRFLLIFPPLSWTFESVFIHQAEAI